MFTVAICDDEECIRCQISEVIWKNMDCIGEDVCIEKFENGETLLKYCRKKVPDIIFLDIKLRGISGIEVSREIRKKLYNEYTQIVYITGLEGCERELFDFQPLNFVGKPLDEKKIAECMMMAYERVSGAKRRFEYIKDYQTNYIETGKIIFIDTSKKGIILHTYNDDIQISSSVSNAYKQLHNAGFIKVSQSALINTKHIAICHKDSIVMKNGVEIYISRSMKREVKMKLMELL